MPSRWPGAPRSGGVRGLACVAAPSTAAPGGLRPPARPPRRQRLPGASGSLRGCPVDRRSGASGFWPLLPTSLASRRRCVRSPRPPEFLAGRALELFAAPTGNRSGRRGDLREFVVGSQLPDGPDNARSAAWGAGGPRSRCRGFPGWMMEAPGLLQGGSASR